MCSRAKGFFVSRCASVYDVYVVTQNTVYRYRRASVTRKTTFSESDRVFDSVPADVRRVTLRDSSDSLFENTPVADAPAPNVSIYMCVCLSQRTHAYWVYTASLSLCFGETSPMAALFHVFLRFRTRPMMSVSATRTTDERVPKKYTRARSRRYET